MVACLKPGTSGGNGCKGCLPGYSPRFCGSGGTHCALRGIHGDTNGAEVHDGIIGCDASMTVSGAIEAPGVGQIPRDDRYQFNISARSVGTYAFRSCGSVGDPYLAVYRDDGTGNLIKMADCDDNTL